MKNILIRPEAFSPFDYDGIAEHLEEMAARGWMVEKARPIFWTYRRTAPARLAFHVSYLPGVSPYDPLSSPGRAEYTDLCGHIGWRHAASWGSAEIFYSAGNDSAPIDTDPALRVWSVHNAAMKSLLPFCAFAVPCMVFCLLAVLWGAVTVPPLTAALCAAVFAQTAVYYTLETLTYLTWYRRAVKAAEKGEWTRSPSLSRLLRVLSALALTETLIFSLAPIITAGTLAPAICAALISALFVGTDLMRERLCIIGASRPHTRAATALATLTIFTAASLLLHLI